MDRFEIFKNAISCICSTSINCALQDQGKSDGKIPECVVYKNSNILKNSALSML